jgi:glycosyltransferase involved in cell wall biosynthesis
VDCNLGEKFGRHLVSLHRTIGAADQDYFDETIRPLLGKPNVDFIGAITDAQKSDFLSGAPALLVPIDWPEPFGLVMIEAMACRTPVIAFNRGSVPEVIEGWSDRLYRRGRDERDRRRLRIAALVT